MIDSYNKILEKVQKIYFSTGSILCPALNNQRVYFNHQGFRHFLRKHGEVRPLADQFRRFSLFRYAIPILSSEDSKIHEVRTNKKGTLFWAIGKNSGKNHLVRIIIRKTKYDKMHFYSVMRLKNKNSG